MQIRYETADDRQAIRALVAKAFGREQEARLVDDLRAGGDLAVSLVAEEEGQLCGHVALSRLKSPEFALALAPVAVSPSEQNHGIGSALIRASLKRAQELGCAIVFVLGEPSYYFRFGFTANSAEPFPCAYAGPYFTALWLSEARPAPAPVVYVDAFKKLE